MNSSSVSASSSSSSSLRPKTRTEIEQVTKEGGKEKGAREAAK